MNHAHVKLPKHIKRWQVFEAAKWLREFYPMMNCPCFCSLLARMTGLPSMAFQHLWNSLFIQAGEQVVWMASPEEYADWFLGYRDGDMASYVNAVAAFFQLDPITAKTIFMAANGLSINHNGK